MAPSDPPAIVLRREHYPELGRLAGKRPKSFVTTGHNRSQNGVAALAGADGPS